MRDQQTQNLSATLDLPVFSRVSISFFSVFCGWAIAFFAFIFLKTHTKGFDSTGNYEFILYWPAVYAFLSWLCLALPFALFSRREAWFFMRPTMSIALGAMAGACLFSAFSFVTGLSQVWANRIVTALFMSFAGTVGAFGFSLHLLLSVVLGLKGIARKKEAPFILISLPFILFFIFKFALWPAIEKCAPGTAYKYGTHRAQNRILRAVIRDVKYGDRLDVLRRKLPEAFSSSGDIYHSVYGDGFSYRIQFREGVVSSIEISDPDLFKQMPMGRDMREANHQLK